MKVFLFDEKHQVVFGEYELGDISESEQIRLAGLFVFLRTKGICNRYKTLIMAESYERFVSEEYGDQIRFE